MLNSMKKYLKYKTGFTILEMLVVIVILTILVSAGGFYYADLHKQTISRQNIEKAVSLGNIMNDIYRTGQLGISGEPLNGLYVTKGTYPEYVKAKEIAKIITSSYGDQFKSGQIVIADKGMVRIGNEAPISDYGVADADNGLNMDPNDQDHLEKHFDKIFYGPYMHQVRPGEISNLCYNYDAYINKAPYTEYDYNCEIGVIYAIVYENGKYQMKPVRKLIDGVSYEYN